MYRRSVLITVAALASLLVALTGCEGPEGPQGPASTSGTLPVYVIGRIGLDRMYYYRPKEEMDSIAEARVDIYNCLGIPSVEINGIRIPPSDPFYRYCNPFQFYDDDLSISCGDSAELLVTYSKSDGTLGTAHASIMLPGQFEITSPDTSYDSISIGDSLAIGWTSSSGADAYIADFRLAYSYWDTTGIQRYFQFYEYDMVLTDTFITFSQVQLFPNMEDIDSIEYSYGSFYLWAMNGPTPDEDQGNVSGDGMGFLNGWTWGGEVALYVRDSASLTDKTEDPVSPMQRLAEQQASRLNLRQR